MSSSDITTGSAIDVARMHAAPSVARRPRRLGAVTAAVTAAVALAASCSTGEASDDNPPDGAASDRGSTPVTTGNFDIPTYEWDRQSGMDALVSGRLALTDEGCTMIYLEGDTIGQPVLFPNAVGVQFENGARAVAEAETGEIFAVEGGELEYGGGFVPVDESWTDMCGDYPHGDVALINDAPALGVPMRAPEPPSRDLPTDVGTVEERGLYEVPTFTYSPGDPMEGALAEGIVTMSADGCPMVDAGETVMGLVLPNAIGHLPQDGPVIYAEHDGMTTLAAEDRAEVSVGGGVGGPEHMAEWERLCPASPVDEVFVGVPTSP